MLGIEAPYTCLWEDIRQYSMMRKPRINYLVRLAADFWICIHGMYFVNHYGYWLYNNTSYFHLKTNLYEKFKKLEDVCLNSCSFNLT